MDQQSVNTGHIHQVQTHQQQQQANQQQQQMQQQQTNGQQFVNSIKPDLRYVPTQSYLAQTVKDPLTEGLKILDKERPPDSASACEWLGNFLINNKNYKTDK